MAEPLPASELDGELQEIVAELCRAINSSLENSDDLAAALERLRSTGYELVLMLDAQLVLDRRRSAARRSRKSKLSEVSPSDKQLLKRLKISMTRRSSTRRADRR